MKENSKKHIRLNLSEVADFVSAATKCNFDVDIYYNRYVVDAKSILGVTDKKENGHATGVIIGLTLTLVHLFGIKFTGTSVNPARSLAPAIFQGGDALSQVWVFIVAPLVGAALAGLFYKYVLKSK